MALQKPVVATEGGGTNEIVIDEITGFLVPAYDTVMLAQKILVLVKDSDLREAMGENGLQRVNTTFSIDKMCARFYQLYEDVLQR